MSYEQHSGGLWGTRKLEGGRGAMGALGAAGSLLRLLSTVTRISSSFSRVLAFFMLLTLMRRRCVSM